MHPSCVRRAPLCRLSLTLALAAFFVPVNQAAVSSSTITAIWANEGGDKVAQEELRATRHVENKTGTTLNRAWNGSTITLAGAHNEVVSFNLVLEAGIAQAQNVSVSFDTLTGPGGAQIHSIPAVGNGIFDWTQRPIELFYIRYLQIRGLSYFGYGKWDERAVPVRFQRPWTGSQGQGYGSWADRPDHDLHYPDIMVPYDLVHNFGIAAGQNQGIWSDIYIPKNIPAGIYRGVVTISENGSPTQTVPVQLTINSFSLPDTPSAKTMIPLDTSDIAWRYVAGYHAYANWQTPAGLRIQKITDRYFELFHRHKLTLVGENECPIMDRPCDSSLPRLNGSLYTANNGYAGPGVATGDGFFSIGTYGGWGNAHYGVAEWRQDESRFRQHTDAWVSWFTANLPGTAFHLYLEDEPPPQDFGQVETWAQWIRRNPGPGQNLPSFVTHQAVLAQTDFPHVAIPAMPAGFGVCRGNAPNCDSPTLGQSVADAYRTTPGFQSWVYNDLRPATGTALTEDDGVSMRQIPWMSYKKQLARYMYWYCNVNTPWDWFTQALTWGDYQYVDPVLGKTGTAASNGNGLLAYPGTSVYPGHTSYGVDGPFASLRIKEWRRGIQDVDYLTLAAQFDPAGVQQIVNTTIPQVLWEYQTDAPSYYTGGGPSWSVNPDDWEGARARLTQIIINHCASLSGALPASPCTDTGSSVFGASPAPPAPVTPTDPPSTPPTPNPPNPVAPVSAPAPPATPITPAPPVSAPNPTPVTPTMPSDTSGIDGLRFVPITPCRLVDTRLPGSRFGGPFIAGGTSKSFLAFTSPCAIPSAAKAFALNATVVPHAALRWLTIWPGGEPQPSVSVLNSMDGRVKANGLVVPAGTNGSIEAYATDDTDLILDISGYFVPSTQSGSLAFYPVTPCRLVDTRSAASSLGGPSLPAGRERSFPVLSSACGLPARAKAYSLNYTAIPKRGLGWMSTWPSGQPQPVVSTLNAPTGAVTANAAVTVAGNNGAISVFASDDTDLVIDVNGYFAPPAQGGLSLYTLTPCRAFDSRTVGQQKPIEGQIAIDFAASSCGVPREAEALILNATTIPVRKLSYLTLWPKGLTRPLVSTLNAGDGSITSNLAFVPTQEDAISLFSTDPAHFITDVFAYFAP